MTQTITHQLHQLEDASAADLLRLFEQHIGEPPRRRHRAWLRREIAWAIQAHAEGGLTEATTTRLAELTQKHDPLQREALRPVPVASGTRRTTRPTVGTVIVREYHGATYEVAVLEDGFRYRHRTYRSLSAVAKRITGAHWNGPLFFGLR